MNEEQKRKPSTWTGKFKVAVRGVKFGIRGQSSFFVHFFFTALVIAAAIILGCNLTQWCMLIGCIGMVMIAEMFNSAIETLFHGLDEETKSRTWPALDIAAGAVLLASITAAIIGGLILFHQLALFLRLPPVVG